MEFTLIEKLGNTGKDGETYLIKNGNKFYALKKYKNKKSVNKIVKEAQLQYEASILGISPKIYECNLDKKYVIMDKLDINLFSLLKRKKGKLSIRNQKKIIQIIRLLDNINIFHGDPNPANFMFRNDKLYIIDFGFSKKINKTLIKKLATNTPNMDYMILGFILKCKELFKNSNYTHLKKFISKNNIIKFQL